MTHKCDQCGRQYCHRHNLSRHILQIHPDVVEDALAGAKGYSDTRFTGGEPK